MNIADLMGIDWWAVARYFTAGNLLLDIVSVPLLMVLFAAVTHLQKLIKSAPADKPPKFMLALFAGAIWLVVKVDIYVNLSVGTKLFLRPPRWKDWTLSKRMSYYWDHYPEQHWCRRIVGWLKVNTWIDRFDYRGLHIGRMS